MSWETVISVISCSYCRKKGEDNDENISLLRNEKHPPLGKPYDKLATEINCKECSHSSGTKHISKPAVSCSSDGCQIDKSFAGHTMNTILPPKTFPHRSSTMNKFSAVPRMAGGDHIPKQIPNYSENTAKASQSVSREVVSANSPLWQQMEDINPPSDSRPPAMK